MAFLPRSVSDRQAWCSHAALRVRGWWQAEAARHFLWQVASFATGIAIYFQWPTEPNWRWMLGGVLLLAALRRCARAHPLLRGLLLVLILLLAGMGWGSYRTAQGGMVTLTHALSPRPLAGVVEDVEQTASGFRVTLGQVQGAAPHRTDHAPEPLPERVRLSVRIKRGEHPALPRVGENLRMMGGLLPPMGPALPHGFDFARYFYFREIGAVGYGLPPWTVEPPAHPHAVPSLMTDFANWRIALTGRILAQLGTREGAIATGLITGEDRAMDEADYNALRGSNLYHIIAISGEHMVIIAGVVFALLRYGLLALLPAPYRYHPRVKTLAAGLTLGVVTVYLGVTGAPLSAVRAYGMILLVLFAVLLRRQVDPMRSLALVAGAMLLWDPSNILEPGFQLSFAATLGIIAMVETVFQERRAAREAGEVAVPEGHVRRLLKATLLVAIVAEAATAPFVISQFNSLALYGPLANMLATSLVSFYLMPTVVLFFLLLPFGGEGLALWLMQKGIHALLWVAHEVASWPHALLFVPSQPPWGVAVGALGLLWVCLWQGRPRCWGLVAMLLGLASIATVTLPDVLIGQGGKPVAIRTQAGYALAKGTPTAMLPELWANGLGLPQLPRVPKDSPDWRCDDWGCVATVRGQRIAFSSDPMSLAEDCRQARLLVTPTWHTRCPHGGAWVLDGGDLRFEGIHALWVEKNGRLRMESSRDWQPQRPWRAVEEGR